MSDSFNNPTPQFGTAEYVGAPGSDRCRFCQQPIAGSYYRLNGAKACRACAEKLQSELPKDSHADYTRALLCGVGAALVGLIVYATFEIQTGIIIGYLSLAVGWMIGKAMMKGSNGRGGRRYQITAALLTYAAVSMAAIPIWIHFSGSQKHGHHAAQQQQTDEEQNQLDNETEQAQSPARSKEDMGKAFLQLAFLGLASPFLELADPFHGAIGLFILFIGVRIAWQLTRETSPVINGPFASSPQPSPGISAG
ncbi:MAG: hypothetical protein WAM78_03585 [Candidatus Sulfotelmatobacter sp.]